jgi:hypothetical protein
VIYTSGLTSNGLKKKRKLIYRTSSDGIVSSTCFFTSAAEIIALAIGCNSATSAGPVGNCPWTFWYSQRATKTWFREGSGKAREITQNSEDDGRINLFCLSFSE